MVASKKQWRCSMSADSGLLLDHAAYVNVKILKSPLPSKTKKRKSPRKSHTGDDFTYTLFRSMSKDEPPVNGLLPGATASTVEKRSASKEDTVMGAAYNRLLYLFH